LDRFFKCEGGFDCNRFNSKTITGDTEHCWHVDLPSLLSEVVQFLGADFWLIYTRRTSPETKFGEKSSDAVQAYARVRAEHGKRRALPSPGFSLNARIPTLPNCVQEGDFNLASTALQNCMISLVDVFFS
jgi:hypothetical protein